MTVFKLIKPLSFLIERLSSFSAFLKRGIFFCLMPLNKMMSLMRLDNFNFLFIPKAVFGFFHSTYIFEGSQIFQLNRVKHAKDENYHQLHLWSSFLWYFCYMACTDIIIFCKLLQDIFKLAMLSFFLPFSFQRLKTPYNI